MPVLMALEPHSECGVIVIPKLYCTFKSLGELLKGFSGPGLTPYQLNQNSWGWKPNINCFQESQMVPMLSKFGNHFTRVIGPLRFSISLLNFGYFYFTNNCPLKFSKCGQ